MTIVLQKDHHAWTTLEQRRVVCLSSCMALKEDIRSLKIGILNIMPQAELYESSLLFPLGRSVIQIEPVWIRLNTHDYSSTNKEHIRDFYISFQDAIRHVPLDGLVLTGAPVEEIPFEEVKYWQEIVDILDYGRRRIVSTLGICWGALAIARFLGMEKSLLPRKLFGAFETENINRNHRITGEMDDVFWCPHSRHAGLADSVVEKAVRDGNVTPLAYSQQAGYTIIESQDHRYLMHLGHLEYEADRLIQEYKRDKTKGRTDVGLPKNINIKKPHNRWRAHALEFFAQWIRYIHEETAFMKNRRERSDTAYE